MDVRPHLHGLSERERVLVMARWFAFRALVEHIEPAGQDRQAVHAWIDWLDENMSDMARVRNAQACRRYWQQRRRKEGE